MRWSLPIMLGVTAVAAGCGGDETQERKLADRPLFAYDASRPLRLADHGRANDRSPVAIRDVTYTSGRDHVQGYLALPPRRGRVPAVVYLHGSGGDRSQLVVPAGWLAARGAVALTITTPSATARRPAGLRGVAGLRWERDLVVRDVVAVRRAIDILSARPDVDAGRIGLVGWSGGARLGAILAGIERRLDASVLMSGGATPVGQYVEAAPVDVRGAVRSILSSIDPLRLVAQAQRGSVFVQNGRRDEVVPRAALDALAGAAPAGTSVRWYAAGHRLNEAAYRDQLSWLSRRLAIEGPAVRGAATGP